MNRDPEFSFQNIFFCGYEYYFLITELIIFNFWLILLDNFVISLMLLYASNQLFGYVKDTLS